MFKFKKLIFFLLLMIIVFLPLPHLLSNEYKYNLNINSFETRLFKEFSEIILDLENQIVTEDFYDTIKITDKKLDLLIEINGTSQYYQLNFTGYYFGLGYKYVISGSLKLHIENVNNIYALKNGLRKKLEHYAEDTFQINTYFDQSYYNLKYRIITIQ